jgi:ketose-bisphosphate aldolase
MKFVNPKGVVRKARDGGYAVPAFNSNGGCYDIIRAAVEAAEDLGSPLILQTYQDNLAYRGDKHAARISALLAEETTVPVALQLDHGHSLSDCREALEAGYTSVMIDVSHLSFEDNISLTKQVIQLAGRCGAAVEGEMGHIVIQKGGNSLPISPKTDIKEAKEYCRRTGVDFLAVAIGTRHGVIESQRDIDFDLLGKLRAGIEVPLVLHGTSGISPELLAKCVQNGIAKANFGEVFRMPYINYFAEYMDTLNHQYHPWRIMQACKESLKEDMKKLIRILGAEGKGR